MGSDVHNRFPVVKAKKKASKQWEDNRLGACNAVVLSRKTCCLYTADSADLLLQETT
jgi:hypothetical protein